jgi:HPt (histidine-containing phosphotransfer) domain-containing protein
MRHTQPGDRPAIRSTLPVEDPVFRQIVVDFAQRLDEQLAVMEAACRDGDYEQLAELAHWLKGAGGTVGFAEFTTPARTLEQCAKQSETDKIATTLTQLRELAQAIEVPPAAEVGALDL